MALTCVLGLGYEPLKVTYEELAQSTDAVVRRAQNWLKTADPEAAQTASTATHPPKNIL